MSTDDRSGYLPPHELRAMFAQVVDRGEAGGVPPTPGPSIALSTPGLAGAALAPTGTPTFAADDPNTIGIMLSRMANELLGASVIPMPTPESLTTGRGMSSPVSPGNVPQQIAQVPGAPSIHTDAITPQLVAQALDPDPVASPSVAGGPSGSPQPESPQGHGGTSTGWGTPGELRQPDFGSLFGASSSDPFAAPFGLVPGSHGSMPSSQATQGGSHGSTPSSRHTQGGSYGAVPSSQRTQGSSQDGSLPSRGSSHGGAMPSSHGARAAHGESSHGELPGSTGGTQPNTGSLHESSLDSVGRIPTSSMTSAAPGRPGGFGMPASNAGSPGGAPGAPASVMPTAPAMPFASSGEHAANSALGRFGAVPPVGGAAISSPGTMPGATMPSGHELQGFAGESSKSLPQSVNAPTTTSSPAQNYSSNPSPNAGSRDVAAPPATPEGRSPFEPTNLDGWSPFASSNHGSVGRLPLVGDGPLDVEPMSSPDFAIPFADDRPFDAAPNFAPQGSQLQGGAPSISGGESFQHGEHAIRQTGGVAFDPYAVRKDFPILEERVHGGKRLVWLDNAATTQKPRAVIDRISRFYEHENSNVHRAAHTLAARATDAFESGRETTRKFLNAPSAQEIIFVRGATEGINLIANTWGQKNIGAGDEILITNLEHHANIVPWQMLCARVGAKLRVAPVDDRGDVILAEYERLITPRTKLVAFTQVSNALGTITPAREMIEIAHRRGACVLLDGAQAVSHMAVDVQALDCDFYVFSGHKVFAPTGIGAVYGKKAILEDMPPWQGGGNMIADVTFEKTVYQPPPWRFEAGTGNIADVAGMGAALDYVMRIGMNVIDRYEHDLLVYATEKLVRIPGLKMIGTSATKASVLSFVLDGQRTEDVGAALDKEGIAVRSGHHCAQPILRRYGLEASVRASLAFYNVCEDVDALVDAVTRLQSHRRTVATPR
jgi:cysteine desulfurase/selenocysteine lyase